MILGLILAGLAKADDPYMSRYHPNINTMVPDIRMPEPPVEKVPRMHDPGRPIESGIHMPKAYQPPTVTIQNGPNIQVIHDHSQHNHISALKIGKVGISGSGSVYQTGHSGRSRSSRSKK
jgi:hypothetical protein